MLDHRNVQDMISHMRNDQNEETKHIYKFAVDKFKKIGLNYN